MDNKLGEKMTELICLKDIKCKYCNKGFMYFQHWTLGNSVKYPSKTKAIAIICSECDESYKYWAVQNYNDNILCLEDIKCVCNSNELILEELDNSKLIIKCNNCKKEVYKWNLIKPIK